MSTEKKSTRRKESRSNRVIHLTVRKIHAAKNNLQTLPPTVTSAKTLSASRNLSTVGSKSPMIDVRLDKLSCTYDHHRNENKKAKCLNSNFRRHVCLAISLLIIASIAMSIVLPILLIKQKTSVTNSVVLRWNSSGIALASLLGGPYGFKLDQVGTLYIAEQSLNRIKKWLFGASSGIVIAGTLGNASDQFFQPVDVLIESNEDMYVTDRGNNRLQFWSNGSLSGRTVAGTGSNGSFNLYGPSGIIRGSNSDELYISDTYNHRIVSYPSGSVLAGGNGGGYTNKQLHTPLGFSYVSYSNSLIIANYGAHNVVQWTLGANNWTLVAGGLNGLNGSSSKLLGAPVGVTVDPMGNVYIADTRNQRIQLFLQGQLEGITIAGVTDVPGANATLLNYPYWVQLDSQLNLYVCEFAGKRIQKFLRY